jgi:hypothetical protein
VKANAHSDTHDPTVLSPRSRPFAAGTAPTVRAVKPLRRRARRSRRFLSPREEAGSLEACPMAPAARDLHPEFRGSGEVR